MRSEQKNGMPSRMAAKPNIKESSKKEEKKSSTKRKGNEKKSEAHTHIDLGSHALLKAPRKMCHDFVFVEEQLREFQFRLQSVTGIKLVMIADFVLFEMRRRSARADDFGYNTLRVSYVVIAPDVFAGFLSRIT